MPCVMCFRDAQYEVNSFAFCSVHCPVSMDMCMGITRDGNPCRFKACISSGGFESCRRHERGTHTNPIVIDEIRDRVRRAHQPEPVYYGDLDEGDVEGTHMECPICLENFQATLVAKCSHAVCRSCCSRMRKTRGVSRRCPLCRDDDFVHFVKANSV
jgi:hypothetical protein